MAQTLSNLRYWTQYLVGDPQMTTYSKQMYTDAINFAIKEYAHKTGATYVETSPAIAVDANGFAVLPTDYMKVNRVVYGGVEMVESDFKFESQRSATWQTDSATAPKRWVLWSGAKIKLTPVVATWPGTCVVGYTEAPTALSADSDTVDVRIPDAHNEYLKYAAGSWLLNLDGDGQSLQQAAMFMNQFNSLIGYSDPVLTAKLNQLRKEGKLEV